MLPWRSGLHATGSSELRFSEANPHACFPRNVKYGFTRRSAGNSPSWLSYAAGSVSETEVCEWCGRSGVHPGCVVEQREAQRAFEEEERAVWNRFGFVPVPGARAVELQRRVFDALGETVAAEDSRQVLENDVAVFVAHGFIGSAGCLLRKTDGVAFRFGSYCPAFVHLWGFMIGIDIVGRTGDQRSNTLVLSKLGDRANATRLLKERFAAPYVRNELVPALERGEQVVLENVDLYFGMHALYRAERSGAFAFEVLPG